MVGHAFSVATVTMIPVSVVLAAAAGGNDEP